MKIKVIVYGILTGGILLLFSSCIGIEASIILDSGGSGKIELSYQISQLVMNLGKLEKEDNFVPLPVSQADFAKTVEKIEGLSVNQVGVIENEDNVIVTASLNFKTMSALSALLSLEGKNSVTLSDSNGNSIFRYQIAVADQAPSEDSLRMAEVFFEGYKLAFTLKTPRQIAKTNIGNVDPDGRTVHFSISMVELIQLKDGLTWEVIF
ncbi:MAG: hypothetical protein AB1798_19555 [Spirochaetota bacterium]